MVIFWFLGIFVWYIGIGNENFLKFIYYNMFFYGSWFSGIDKNLKIFIRDKIK